MKAFDKFCDILDGIASVVCTIFVIFLTLLIGINVIMRYVFSSPIAWQYEATLVCMSWIVFIGMVITFHNDENMRLTFVSNAMPEKVRNVWIVVMDLITLAFLIVGGYYSISVVQNAMSTSYQTIPVSKMFFYLPFPIGCAMSACQIINISYKRLTGRLNVPAEEEEV
ncbi:MAG: TRAP transporter small permease [Lachnospiraceae bacterium]|nr:TRAP transporter small permease [Lachnospiraceae bacterium]